ncbi:MAG: hypothetical protein ACN2B6_05975 [Rickettsiales bacterium]
MMKPVLFCRYLWLICLFLGGEATAQERQFDRFDYPQKSFAAVSDELITPYFNEVISTPIHYGELRFDLWNLLPKTSRDFRRGYIKYDPEKMRRVLSGATAYLAGDSVTLANGKPFASLKYRTKESNWYSLALANFDQGIGLELDFKPLPYRVYFSPMTATNIRIYTVSPQGRYWDKTYNELDKAHRIIWEPDYFYVTLDASIRGDFSDAMLLPPHLQELLVDSVAISVAEYYQGKKVYLKDFPPVVSFFRDPATRISPPFFNTMLAQYHNYRVKQVAPVNLRKNGLYILQRAKMGNYYNKSNYLPKHRYVNERVITRALTFAHPYELSLIRSKLAYRYHDNYFDMLCHLVLHPELYDEEMRMALRRVIKAAPDDVLAINWQLGQYLQSAGRL